MNWRKIAAACVCAQVLGLLAACGGGGGSAPTAPVVVPTAISIDSDAGDWVGQGKRYNYSQVNASVQVEASKDVVRIYIRGDESWNASFALNNGQPQLLVGKYTASRYLGAVAATPGMDINAESRGCNTLHGSFTVNSVTYSGTLLTDLDISFDQYCDPYTVGVHGRIHWAAADATQPPGPVKAIPQDLWTAPAGSTPSTGNYVYLSSTSQDYVGSGRQYSYNNLNAVITTTTKGALLKLGVRGDTWWDGNFQGMSSIGQLQTGYYPGLKRNEFHNPAKGGLDWDGDSRGCNELHGWFVVDKVEYLNGALTAIDLRFEQYCDLNPTPLHGQVHWSASDTMQAPGPVNPAPSGLWKAPQGATPSSGNYVYLSSEVGDYMGGGKQYLYTLADSLMNTNDGPVVWGIGVNGDLSWGGAFYGMSAIQQLQVGYYGGATRSLSGNPTRGRMEWSGNNSSCNTLDGWFVIDAIDYKDGKVSAIDMRFEQRCTGYTGSLHGQIHWNANDKAAPVLPVNPPPTGLWSPSAGATPSSGNYVFLQSDAGDSVGAGKQYTFLSSVDDILVATGTQGGAGELIVQVRSAAYWLGSFEAMAGVFQFQEGYYGNLRESIHRNVRNGGLNWWGDGRSCTASLGWFVIDRVVYTDGVMKALDMRFEQRCTGAAGALHGQVHWVSP